MARSESEVMADILARFDSDGNLRKMLRSFEAMVENPVVRLILNLTSVRPSQIDSLLDQQRHLLINSARGILLFAPRGWAPCGLTQQSMIDHALDVFDQTGSIEQAERILVEGWNDDPVHLRFCETRLWGLGRADEGLGELCRPRATMVEKALKHHYAGAFEASVPIVLAQIDGLVLDMTENAAGFFIRKGNLNHLRDTSTIAGVDEGLASLQVVFGIGQEQTGATGGISRHGILHGRELGYDTLINSTKCFVLLLSVIEWAQPRAQEIARRRQAERHARYAGSDEVDVTGRRMDRRGFSEMRAELRTVWTRQIAEYRRQNRYPSDLRLLFPPGTRHGESETMRAITLEVTTDGQEFWAWGRTPSGWVLGLACKDGSPMDYLYAGRDRPSGDIESGCWEMDTPPDWRSP